MPNTKATGVAYLDPLFESITLQDSSGNAGTLTGNVAGNVTGNVTGNTTGTSTGNIILPTATVAATGTNQATAAAVTTGFTLVSAADGTVGVKLPTAVAGSVCVIKNNAAAVLKIWPFSGDAINAIAADGSFSIASLTSVVLVAYDATTWYSVPLLPS